METENKFQITLAAARVNAKMTQADVAREMETTIQTVLNWEHGRSEPTIGQARKLSNLFAVPLNHIFFKE